MSRRQTPAQKAGRQPRAAHLLRDDRLVRRPARRRALSGARVASDAGGTFRRSSRISSEETTCLMSPPSRHQIAVVSTRCRRVAASSSYLCQIGLASCFSSCGLAILSQHVDAIGKWPRAVLFLPKSNITNMLASWVIALSICSMNRSTHSYSIAVRASLCVAACSLHR